MSRSVVSMSEIDSSGNGDSSRRSIAFRYPLQFAQTSIRRSFRSGSGAAVMNFSLVSSQ